MSDLRDGLRANGLDLDSMPEDQQTAITERFIVGDPDTVGAQLADDLALGVDGFTINLPVNGHVPGRVALLGETASKVIAAP